MFRGFRSPLLHSATRILRSLPSRTTASFASSPAQMALKISTEPTQPDYQFGPWKISAKEVFALTERSFAFVNLKPLVPGHVLVSPIRVVKRFTELTPEEVSDMWVLAQAVGSKIEAHVAASSLTMAIQDGPQAGQTVAHVHIHILPRKGGDFEKNDEVYDALDKNESQATELRASGGDKLDLDVERKPRTREEMAAEAAEFRKLFAAP